MKPEELEAVRKRFKAKAVEHRKVAALGLEFHGDLQRAIELETLLAHIALRNREEA